MALILWFTLPIVSVRGTSRGLEGWDVVLAVLFIALVGFETYADQLQWTFQNAKKRRRQLRQITTSETSATRPEREKAVCPHDDRGHGA